MEQHAEVAHKLMQALGYKEYGKLIPQPSTLDLTKAPLFTKINH